MDAESENLKTYKKRFRPLTIDFGTLF
jgi:hypothetical protein